MYKKEKIYKIMVKKCVYCRGEITDDRAIDVCDSCGVGVWGPKMFKAIKGNMDSAREKGDLFQGSVTDSCEVKIDKTSGLKV